MFTKLFVGKLSGRRLFIEQESMERYLTSSQIRQYPTHKKFKKTSYGGAKVFIKEDLVNKYNQAIEGEYYCHNGVWHMSSVERKRLQSCGVVPATIRAQKLRLQSGFVKYPIDVAMGREQYEKLYADYPDADELGYYKKNSPEYIRVKDILSNVKKNSLVYDVGCNSGGIGSLLIKNKHCTVYGSELCQSLGRKASQKGLRMFIGWAEETSYKEEYFDYAVMTFILEHVIHPQVLMSETMRVLKKNGVILGHVPTASGDWGKQTIGKHPEHLRAYSYQELKKLLHKSGLRKIQISKKFLVGRRVADYYFFMGTK